MHLGNMNLPILAAAFCIASSSACCVGSLLASTSLCVLQTTSVPQTTTAPTGTSFLLPAWKKQALLNKAAAVPKNRLRTPAKYLLSFPQRKAHESSVDTLVCFENLNKCSLSPLYHSEIGFLCCKPQPQYLASSVHSSLLLSTGAPY